MPPVDALVFDPENVFYEATLWRRWLRQMLVRMGLDAPFPQCFTAWDRDFLPDIHLGRRDCWEGLMEFLSRAGLSFGQIAEVLAAGKWRKQRFDAQRRCLPGVKEALVQLAGAGMPLYVLANASQPFERMSDDLAAMGLRHLFRGGRTSLDLGRAMPQEGFYLAALEHFGLESRRTAYIAHSEMALRAAHGAGILTVACNGDLAPPSWYSIERLADLPPMLPAAGRINPFG